jgi:hypothetical protein
MKATAPNTDTRAVEGSGTAAAVPICTVRESASAPVPHVHVYVPGCSPRVDMVVPIYVSVALRGCPDSYVGGARIVGM